jgi:hypothetical protein
MTTNDTVTRTYQFSAEDELRNAGLIRALMERPFGRRVRRLDLPRQRAHLLRLEPGDPVRFPNNECFYGLRALAEMNQAYSDQGFTYVVELHSVYAVGPLVIVTRTDFRKEDGQPDVAFPAVGVFAFKDGKIIEWSDYYR